MISKKIINIKNVLRIIISVLVIFSMIKSCSKAFTYSEFYDFIEETNANGDQPANMYSNLNFFLRSDVQNFITTKQNLLTMFPNLETSSNLSFIITKPSNDSLTFDLYMYEFEDCDCTIALDTSYQNMPKCNMTNMVNCLYGAKIKVYLYNGQIGTNEVLNLKTSSNMTQHWVRNANMTGLIQSTNFTNNTSLLFTNQLNNNPLEFYHPFSENYNYNGETIQANTFNYRQSTSIFSGLIGYNELESLKFELIDNIDNITIENNYNVESKRNSNTTLTFQDLTDYGTLSIGTLYLKQNRIYVLKVYGYKDNEEYSIEEKYIWFPSGTIINNGTITNYVSGETYTIQDQTIAQEELQKENQGFFENLYNNMFTINSGDMNNAVIKALTNNNWGITGLGVISGDITLDGLMQHIDYSKLPAGSLVSGDILLLGALQGNPTDFIINWDNVMYKNNLLIPSGEINFSKEIRENEALSEVQTWLHVILGYSVITLMLVEIWFLVLKVLGVSTSIYDSKQEELDKLERIYEEKVHETTVITESGEKHYLTSRRRLK